MLTTLPFSGFYCSKWSNELDDVENNFIENEAVKLGLKSSAYFDKASFKQVYARS